MLKLFDVNILVIITNPNSNTVFKKNQVSQLPKL